jgi:hypothetical protein
MYMLKALKNISDLLKEGKIEGFEVSWKDGVFSVSVIKTKANNALYVASIQEER